MNVRIDLPDEILEEITAEVARRVLDAIGIDTQRRLLPVTEAASVLGLSEGALRKHAQRGNIPIVRLGHRILIDIDALT